MSAATNIYFNPQNSMAQPEPKPPPPLEILMVTSADSPEFYRFQSALCHSSVVALDAEWKPVRSRQIAESSEDNGGERTFPKVTLLQIACRISRAASDSEVYAVGKSLVFLVDLLSIPLSTIWELLREVFVSPSVLKLGFRFKQDLAYLSSTFFSQGFLSGFDKIEPFIDITSIYYHMKYLNRGKKFPKDTISLATICWEVLSISLSKDQERRKHGEWIASTVTLKMMELQCSDWSCRPLTEGQISYAAADAYYLLEIFAVFEQKFLTEGKESSLLTELSFSKTTGGLKEIFTDSSSCKNVVRIKFCSASDMIKSCYPTISLLGDTAMGSSSQPSCKTSYLIDDHILDIVKMYGERIHLKEADRKPRVSRRKREQSSVNTKRKEEFEINGNWQALPPWDPAYGGDGCSKFLCDVMVEGLARHLRCVGIDAAVPSIRKPEPRQLLDQAYKEKRVLLTRDAKLLKYQYLANNQVYRIKSLLKNDQLLEVIETFHLNISEEQLMSRCTKCNGSFFQKPLTLEEAIEASKGFQVIPNCLFNKDIEFWQCTDCKQLYWEGTQYRNAVEKFVNICKLNT
ncbi:uncharacterized protein LOC110094700 isoform X1 [Dendrobium catenatum]|uniref:uncharacterized protein LOC110094700 isoform X1 n=1 Tax=Dendrobium catenatum TaxID=906689 RepID=UPI0010A00DE2|nr:uncharacterized protein LOC110094700 isoform X1 [Dendrobium catenatum]